VVPFSSHRKLTATFDHVDGALVAYVKGAPGRLIELSDKIRAGNSEQVLDEAGRARLMAINDGMARRGLRVLGIASGAVTVAEEAALHGLTFAGFLGLMDPPAPGVKASIARLREAGLRTIMITGDQRLTAEAIGRQLGLLSSADEIVDGRELHSLSAEALSARLPRVGGFSRVTPEDKLVIVGALQAGGDIVAMIGDGVNDAAALKKADVGVAMGVRGTDVAKEAAAIVLQDDRFETIVAAVEEGRIIYDNIRKFVFYLFSCNLAEILVLLVATLAALPPPLLPLQILWINIVTDTLPALSLAVEPGDGLAMHRPPRDPHEAILSRRFLLQIALYAGLISGSTLAAFVWALSNAPEKASTIAFMTLAIAQILHLGNARDDRALLSARRILANPYAIGAVVVSIAVQIAPAEFAWLGRVLNVATLATREWIVIVSSASVTALVGQAIRVMSGGTGAVRPKAS
jgi:Ca2+-transporting ATPase